MSTDGTSSSPHRIRTSDAERERVAEALRNAVTEGRLSLEEGDERLAALYATKFRDELPSLVADLPAGEAWATKPATPSGSNSGSDGGPQRGPKPGWSDRPGPDRGRRGPWGPSGPEGRGSGSGGPGTGGPGGMGRRIRVLRGLRFVFPIAIVAIVFGVTGHFFWPIIPILFLLGAVRFGAARHAYRHGHGYGCGQGHRGQQEDDTYPYDSGRAA